MDCKTLYKIIVQMY